MFVDRYRYHVEKNFRKCVLRFIFVEKDIIVPRMTKELLETVIQGGTIAAIKHRNRKTASIVGYRKAKHSFLLLDCLDAVNKIFQVVNE